MNLDDVDGAVRSVREARGMGAVAVMVLGTAGDRLLDEDDLLPFYEAVEGEGLALGVHVGWSCPSVNNLYSHIYPSGVIAFHMPVLMACASLMAGGVLDRFPDMRVVFLEAGCMWVPFMLDRLKHRYENQGELLLKFIPETVPKQALPAMEYVRKGNLYFSAEIEDSLLPQVMDLVGQGQIVHRDGHAPRRPGTLCRAHAVRADRHLRRSQGRHPGRQSQAALRSVMQGDSERLPRSSRAQRSESSVHPERSEVEGRAFKRAGTGNGQG